MCAGGLAVDPFLWSLMSATLGNTCKIPPVFLLKGCAFLGLPPASQSAWLYNI